MVALRTADQYREQLQALLPTGPAWDPELTPEVDTILGGVAAELARLDGRMLDLVGEMDPATTTEMLADWERVAGLPDKCAGTLESTVQGRRNALLAKLTATGGQSKAYFIAIAAALGYEITIEEFRPFRAGRSVAGDVLTNSDWVFTWRVRAPEVTVIPFRAGQSAAGEQLRAWGNDTLTCKIRQLAPAHTVVLFAYANSSLDLLFTSGAYLLKQQPVSFSSLVNFTRASTGTYLGAAGVLQTAAADAPRFEFDASGAPRGLLFEQQRVNIALQSNDFANAAWSKSNTSVEVPGVVLAPDGSPATRLVESAASADHIVQQNGKPVVGNTKYCRSVFAKADSANRYLVLNTAAFGNWVVTGTVTYDLVNGVVVSGGAGLDGVGIEAYPDGWFRCWLASTTVAAPAAVPINIFISQGGATNYLGDGTSGIYIFGAQLEAGDSPSSYIPTLAAPVTRAADLAHVPAGSWLQAGEGTLFCEYVPHGVTVNAVCANLGTTSAVGRVMLWLRASDQKASAWVVNDAAATEFSSVVGPAFAPGQTIKQAIAYKANDFQFSAAGVLGPGDMSGSLPTIDRLTLGARGVSTDHLQGHIRRIRYYPRRLSESELVALTTS